ncbi:lysozyme inhibitor LprI family protein [Azospirillum sp. B4]|uniref:lysozyme inhibitor LprI family protein n=1 Tax=Azospirillum sp. B4 TaxID=95605 RepID=UPI0011DC7877|nr:hypothetical protein [Azospirillum sp. B4]
MLAFLVPLVFSISRPARADEADMMVAVNCDQKATIATLRFLTYYPESEPAPPGELYDAESFPRYDDHRRPRVVCDFGGGKTVSITVGINPYHLDSANATIHVGHVETVSAPFYTFPTDRPNYATDVRVVFSSATKAKVCVNNAPCRTLDPTAPNPEARVEPSFDCAKASAPLDLLICHDPWLPAYDRRMADVFRQLIRPTGLVPGVTDAERSAFMTKHRAWLKSRASACGIPDHGSLSPNAPMGKALDCLADLYDDYTTELSKLMAKHLSSAPALTTLLGTWSDKCGERDPRAFVLTLSKAKDGTIAVETFPNWTAFADIDTINQYTLADLSATPDGGLSLILLNKMAPDQRSQATLARREGRLRLWSLIGDDDYEYVKEATAQVNRGTGMVAPWMARCPTQ